jgi:2,4-dienoyl-CoA reductase-like NADH-dependent reductase (Old Yellow Enzyme family)
MLTTPIRPSRPSPRWHASISRAQADVAAGRSDAVVFGKAFISNPDLVARLQQGAPLAAVDFERLYTPGAEGYTDYPAWRCATEGVQV